MENQQISRFLAALYRIFVVKGASTIKFLWWNQPFAIGWILIILLCDVLAMDFYLLFCSFPKITKDVKETTRAIVIADPQLTDAYSYKQSGILLRLTEFYSDIYMIRNFKRIQAVMKPQVIIFAGDLMDGGREWGLEQFQQELSRFNKIFSIKPGTQLLGIAGNHDIGFGEAIVPAALSRYLETFGALNTLNTEGLANHTFITLDTIGLSGLKEGEAYKAASKFLEDLEAEELGPKERRILLTHVPLYRPEGSDCGPWRKTAPIRNMRGYQFQNMIQPDIANKLLGIIQPDLIISGDDHDDCIYMHKYAERNSLEGNPYPAFGVMSLRGLESTPYNEYSRSYLLDVCFLPPQLPIYKGYIALLILTFIGMWMRAYFFYQTRYRRLSLREGHLYTFGSFGFVEYFLRQLAELIWIVALFYLAVLIYLYYF